MNSINQIIADALKNDSKEINLSCMNLKEFPQEIFHLNNIDTIKLMHNQISEIPFEIINLHNLKHLYLYNNNISTISEDLLLQMPYLENFDLAENPIDYNKVILFYQRNNTMFGYRDVLKKIKDYTEGHLRINNKCRIIPQELFKLKNLQNLTLSLKSLDKIPENFSQLNNLENLDLSGNKLSNLPESFSKLIKLKSLNLSHNNFKSIPNVIWSLPNLKNLIFNHNQLQNFDLSILNRSLSNFCAIDNPFNNFNSREFEYYNFSELKSKYNRTDTF